MRLLRLARAARRVRYGLPYRSKKSKIDQSTLGNSSQDKSQSKSNHDDVSTDTDLISFQHTIFGQDKPILENQVPARMPLERGVEIPTRCDAMSVAYRRWLTERGTSYGAIAANAP